MDGALRELLSARDLPSPPLSLLAVHPSTKCCKNSYDLHFQINIFDIKHPCLIKMI